MNSEPRLNHRVHALLLVRDHLNLPARENGLRYRGVEGGSHLVSDSRGRWFSVDLVLRSVALRVGVMPRPQVW